MMLAFEIRDAQPADADSLCGFAWRMFRETFVEELGIPYPPADLEQFRTEAYQPSLFARWIASPEYSVSVAEADGDYVGYAVAGPCSFDHALARVEFGELKRLYVSRDGQGRGIAPRLLAHALQSLEDMGRPTVLLSVWSGNHRAQAFYAKHGFERIAEFKFPVGSTLDDEFLMRRG